MSTHQPSSPLCFVTQNNSGLAFLKSGDIIQARNCFTDALRGALVELIQEGGDNVAQSQPQQCEQDPTPAAAITTTATTTTLAASHQHQSSLRSATTCAFREQMFARLRTLPTCNLQDQAIRIFMDTSQASSANMSLVYAVIVYNMGLVYQVAGRKNNASHALAKAMELYKKSLNIVRMELLPQDEIMAESRNPIIDLLHMLLLKHLADIHIDLSNFELAKCFSDELSAFITSVGSFVYRDREVTDLMQTQVGCFLMFSLSLDQGSRMAPAA